MYKLSFNIWRRMVYNFSEVQRLITGIKSYQVIVPELVFTISDTFLWYVLKMGMQGLN